MLFPLTTVLERTVLLSSSHFHPVLQEAMVNKLNSQSKRRLSNGKGVASSNWFDLKKTLDSEKPAFHRKKRHKLDSRIPEDIPPSLSPSYPQPVLSKLSPAMPSVPEVGSSTSKRSGDINENSQTSLRSMALALEDKFSDEQRLPGRYLALDCEMVGVGINASESSLARVSLVNYYGVVMMDEFVKQRERVVDYRTRWSGIRASNMIYAKPFEDVQKAVNELLDGRILIGHAVHNDLKALLLSHPIRETRDTQSYAYKFALSKSRQISLKNLAKQELGIDIQTGEHSSVVDARATMAIYRLHKKDWERARGPISQIPGQQTAKRKWSTQLAETDGLPDPDGKSTTFQSDPEKEEVEETSPTSNTHRKKRTKTNKSPTSSFPGGGRKGISSGLSTVQRGKRGQEPTKSKYAWWKLLPSGDTKAPSVRLDR